MGAIMPMARRSNFGRTKPGRSSHLASAMPEKSIMAAGANPVLVRIKVRIYPEARAMTMEDIFTMPFP